MQHKKGAKNGSEQSKRNLEQRTGYSSTVGKTGGPILPVPYRVPVLIFNLQTTFIGTGPVLK